MRISRAISFALFAGLTGMVMFASTSASAAEPSQSSVDELVTRGREALAARRPEEAISAFDSVIALDPANAIAFHYRGSARMQKQDSDGALADVEKAISIDPGYAMAYRTRGAMLSATSPLTRSAYLDGQMR